jgi:hypothetical protein
VTGAAAVVATAATIAAAVFAYGAYTAALETVSETRRQADIAQHALVASTRARLKLTAVKDITATRREGCPTVLFQVDAAYRNFGQSPAQNIFLRWDVRVLGAGLPPREFCERAKGRVGEHSFEVVFPQNDEGGMTYTFEISLDEINAQAAEVAALQPDEPVELGIVGCLTYRSAGGNEVHVTGFSGELDLADAARAGESGHATAYDAIVESDGPVEIGVHLTTRGAWAD